MRRLTDNTSWITAVANDLSFEQIFLQQLMQYGRPGDLVVAISGYALYLEHRLEEAEEVLRRALELRPLDAAISNNLAILLGEQGRNREALAMFRRTGTQAQAHANLALMYVQQGEFEKAETNFSRALTLDPGLRAAAEALTQLADYEDVYQWPPTGRPAPPVDAGLVFEEPPLVKIQERPLAKAEKLPPAESEERPLAESEEPLLAEFQEPPALKLVGRPLVDVTAEATRPDVRKPQVVEPETQQAAYLVEEPQAGVVVASNLEPSASSEREKRAAGSDGHPPATAPEPSQEGPDVWSRLGGAASKPSQPSGY